MSSNKPRIILGLMNFGPPGTEGQGARVTSLDDFNNYLDYFQEQGYSQIDSAQVYTAGKNEDWVRQAKWQKRGLEVATKSWPVKPGDHAAAALTQSIDKSLSELGSESVDIFYLHAPDRSVPYVETLKALDKVYRQGKFKKLGLSNFAAWEVAEICTIAEGRGWVKPSIYQAMYNAITRSIEEELVPCCRKFGLDIVIFNPLAGGIFSGKYKSKEIDPANAGRFGTAGNAAQGTRYRDRYFRDEIFDSLAIIQPVIEKHSLTLLETALRWCVHHSKLKIGGVEGGQGNDGVLIGVSSIRQLQGNLKNLEKGPLPQDVVEVLDKAWKICKGTAPRYWQ